MRGATSSLLLIISAVYSDTCTRSAGSLWFEILVPIFLFVGFLSVSRHADAFTQGRPADRQHASSLLELVSFSWARKALSPDILKSSKIRDLPALQGSLSAEHLSKNAGSNIRASDRLALALAKAYAHPILLQWTLAIFQSFVVLAPHTIIYRLLEWLSDEPRSSVNYGLGLALLLGAAVLSQVLIESWLRWITTSKIRIPIDATLNSMVYRKALRLPNTTPDSTGQSLEKAVLSQMKTYRQELYPEKHIQHRFLTQVTVQRQQLYTAIPIMSSWPS